MKLEPAHENSFLFSVPYRSLDYCVLIMLVTLTAESIFKNQCLVDGSYISPLLTCSHFIMACKKVCVICRKVPDDNPYLFNFGFYQ
jgi:hypothetical protein